MIKYIYLIHTWDINWYYLTGQSVPEGNDNKQVFHMPQFLSPEHFY